MSRKISIAVVALPLLLALACNPLSGALGGGGTGTVANLWSDVPPYPAAEKSDVELPLVARLAVEAASRAIMTEAGDSAGDLEVISFSTGDDPGQVMSYYSSERMTAQGWSSGDQDELGCSMGSTESQEVGGLCAFGKDIGDEFSALFIVIVPASEGVTDLFYVRIDANPAAISTAAAQ